MRVNDVIADGNPNSGFELRMFRWQFIYRLQRLDFRKWRCLMGKFELFFWLVFTWLECVFITKHCFFMVIVICGVLKRFRMSPTLCRWYSFSSGVGTSAEWFWLLLINCVGGIFDPPHPSLSMKTSSTLIWRSRHRNIFLRRIVKGWPEQFSFLTLDGTQTNLRVE